MELHSVDPSWVMFAFWNGSSAEYKASSVSASQTEGLPVESGSFT